MHCRTRKNNDSIADASKLPILLSRDHHYTHLIIRESQELLFHNGLRETLKHIGLNIWVLRGREKVKKIIRACITFAKGEVCLLQVALYQICLVFGLITMHHSLTQVWILQPHYWSKKERRRNEML